jgi:hypothetical protein
LQTKPHHTSPRQNASTARVTLAPANTQYAAVRVLNFAGVWQTASSTQVAASLDGHPVRIE